MHKWIITTVVGLSIIISFVVIKYGLRPKPIPIIKASNFEEPKKLATYLHRQLFQKFKSVDVIVFGFNKANSYESEMVNAVIEIVTKENREKLPEFVFLTPEESYSASGMSRQPEVKRRYGEKMLAFTVINLEGVSEADGIEDCEKNREYPVWINCMKSQKMRQMNRARRVDTAKTIAIVENQSLEDIFIYIRP